ncbi:heparinase II/III-family protein [Ruania suaedae]|uniref:heparinase II/III domain-containing protein n=1 Tax=Ruania suaedae TaxID=2897774 RepID=UPI001E5FA14A|nr:heparinase II/III family protein [Ruania suaedae]UFU02619.1 heparinase II/III-family protein [Ruania suaedae]
MTSPGPLLTHWGDRAAPSSLAGLLADALPAPARWEPGPDLDQLIGLAEEEQAEPWPSPQASHYARFTRDGDRSSHEDRVRGRQARLTRAAVRAAAAPPDRLVPLLDEVADGVLLLCEQTSWCWVAHDPAPARTGTVVPPIDPWLDLGAGEIAAQLAWVDRLLGPALDEHYPGLRVRMRAEAGARVLHPFLDQDWPWFGEDMNNWCPWICGNVIAAAVQLMVPSERRSAVVAKAVVGLDRYLRTIPADGSVDEGYGYWWEGVGRALEALDLLERVTAGALTAAGLPVIGATVAFPHRMHLGGPWHVNVADSSAQPQTNVPWHVLERWARRVGDDDAERYARSRGSAVGISADWPMNLARVIGALDAPIEADRVIAEPPLPAQVWLPDLQLGLVREQAGSARGLTLVLKGGHNGEGHNHQDVGSVIVASDGVPVLVDPGRLTYRAGMFGPQRYEFWAMQSQWHNVPVVAGHQQEAGRDARALEMTFDEQQATIGLDLARVHDVPLLRHWHREARWERSEVLLTDRWEFAAMPERPSALHLMLAGEVTLTGTRADIVPLEGANPVRLAWSGDVTGADLEDMPLEDPLMSEVWGERLTRLRLHLAPSARGEAVLRITRAEDPPDQLWGSPPR